MTDARDPKSAGPRPVAAMIIAIDGPAASGKSSTAAAVARALGFVHIDSGSLYRALTWIAVRSGLGEAAEILAEADRRHVGLIADAGTIALNLDDLDDIESAIRTPEVNASVSRVAAMPSVRHWVNANLRRVIEHLDGVVIDGRDIGTAVVPGADLKIFLTATAAARAERRLRQRGDTVDGRQLAAETTELERRDQLDTSRAADPLRTAPDAVVLDTTGVPFEQQVARIVAIARQRALR